MAHALSHVWQHLDEQMRTLYKYVRENDARLDAAAEVALRIRVVPALEDLPAEAEATEWFRVVATPAAVYVGNGTGRPLSKLTTSPL